MGNDIKKGTISPAQLSESLSQMPGEIYIIDLMSKEEFTGRHVPGAVNIPLEELGNHISEIPKDKTVVVTCRMGLTKSDLALLKLQDSGIINAKKIEGGTTGWFEIN